MPADIPKAILTGWIATASLMFGCNAHAGGFYDEFSEPYFRRYEGITFGAGNAKAVNAATHIIDPWPRYVGNRRIPANGERMTGAIERYRDPRKLLSAPPPLAPASSGMSGSASSGATEAPAAASAPK
jgi:hypothetical protein